jgi:hypothetical protein
MTRAALLGLAVGLAVSPLLLVGLYALLHRNMR